MGFMKHFQSLDDDREYDGVYQSIIDARDKNKTYSIPEYGIRKDIVLNSNDDLQDRFKSFVKSFDESLNKIVIDILKNEGGK